MRMKEIREAYSVISKEMTEFVGDEIKSYRDKGVQIHVGSYTEQAKWIFLMGKLKMLETSIESIIGGKKNERTKKVSTGTKTTAKKGRRKTDTATAIDDPQGVLNI